MSERHVKLTRMQSQRPESSVSIRQEPRTVKVYSVFAFELENLHSAQSSLEWTLALFGAMVSVSGTGAGILLTMSHSLSPAWLGVCSGLTLASTVLTLYFGVSARRGRRYCKQKLDALLHGPQDENKDHE
jgi:hypothetical protein